MKSFPYIFILTLALTSCTDQKKEPTINWEKELFGIGYMGVEKDSLETLFEYFQMHEKQPDRFRRAYEYWPDINGDTIIFPNIVLGSFLSEKEEYMNFRFDSSIFVMSYVDTLIQFDKVTGNVNVPSKLYLKKVSNQFPKEFQYQFVDGWDRIDHFEYEVVGENLFSVTLRGSPFEPYFFELNELDSADQLFINSYLNLVTENRYDTTDNRFNGVISCGVGVYEKMVYNDSVFEYSTYVQRRPNSRILLDYLRSKVDSTKHMIEVYDMDYPKSKPKEFEHLPVAIERAWIPPPVEEVEPDKIEK